MRRRAVWGVLAALVVGYAAFAVLVAAGQRRMLFLPDTGRPVAPGDVPGLREVELRTADGLTLLAWYVPAGPGRPVVAYFHGNGGNLANRAGRLRGFAARGWGVLMPEYRGYGGNDGQPGEAGFAIDAAAAMEFLDAQGMQRAPIVYGESIGTGVAVRVAAGRAVGGVVLESPYASVTDLARRRFPFLPVTLLLRDPFDSLSRIGLVAAPVLVLQGLRDRIVPPDSGRALFAAAPEPKEIWVAPEAGHNDLMQHGAAEVVAEFVERVWAR